MLGDTYTVMQSTPPSDVGRQLLAYVTNSKWEFTPSFLEAIATTKTTIIDPIECETSPKETTIYFYH